jgi:cardiolipin synthase
MNVADYYIKGLPKIGSWRDMHIRIQGKAVKYLQDIFLEMWNETTKQQVKGAAYYPQFSGDTAYLIKASLLLTAHRASVPKKCGRLMQHPYGRPNTAYRL